MGLLGSDVLGRFGAVRIDFTAGALVLGGPEGPPLDAAANVVGPAGPPPPAVLTQGEAGTTVPLSVTVGPGRRLPQRGGALRPWATAAVSSSTPARRRASSPTSVARAQSLPSTDLAQRQATVCSVITVPLVRSGPWSVPGRALYPQLIGQTDFGAIASATQGLLGSDQLKRYGWVVLDYAGGRMILG